MQEIKSASLSRLCSLTKPTHAKWIYHNSLLHGSQYLQRIIYTKHMRYNTIDSIFHGSFRSVAILGWLWNFAPVGAVNFKVLRHSSTQNAIVHCYTIIIDKCNQTFTPPTVSWSTFSLWLCINVGRMCALLFKTSFPVLHWWKCIIFAFRVCGNT